MEFFRRQNSTIIHKVTERTYKLDKKDMLKLLQNHLVDQQTQNFLLNLLKNPIKLL